MGSSQDQWERGTKLLASALDLLVQNARTPEEWADYLQVFVFGRRYEIPIDKSDRAMQPFNKGEFTYVESGLKPEHYQLKGTGVQDRKFKVINLWERFPKGHDPTTQELLDLVKAVGEDPDFADTKAFLRDNPVEATNEHPLISLCGSIVSRYGARNVACFRARSDERSLDWDWLDGQWPRDYRLLVAC